MSIFISIIIPIYNLENYIVETLESVKNQTYDDFEVIIVDDDSNDKTVEIIESFIQFDPRFNLCKNTHSKGVSGARNTGLVIAQGTWINFLDGDDVLPENALALKVKAIDTFPNCQFFTSDYHFWYPDGRYISHTQHHPEWKLHFLESLLDARYCEIERPVEVFLESVLTCVGVACVSKKLFDKVGLFSEKLISAEDHHMWLRLSNQTDTVVYIPSSTLDYRQREGGLSKPKNGFVEMNTSKMYYLLYKDIDFKLHRKKCFELMKEYNSAAYFWYRNNNFKLKAIYYGVLCVRYDLFSLAAWRKLLLALLLVP